MNTQTAQNAVREATAWAMETSKAFSWLKTQDVQKGVYVKYTQSHFAKYLTPRNVTAN